MPSVTMAQISALLAAEKSAVKSPTSASFPFWDAPDGTTSIVRFLPNRDPEALPIPMVTKYTNTLPFSGGVNGESGDIGPCTVRTPCLKTWGLKCYITETIKPFWSGSEEEREFARLYYHKPAHLMAALVVSTPIVETPPADNPIRTLSLNKSVWGRIEAALLEPDLEDVPWDYDTGRDFKIIKTRQGSWANWTTSALALKVRPLIDAERAAVAEHGLIELRDLLGPVPDAAVQTHIREMFHASVAGEPFDPQKWPGFRAYSKSTTKAGNAINASAALAQLRSRA